MIGYISTVIAAQVGAYNSPEAKAERARLRAKDDEYVNSFPEDMRIRARFELEENRKRHDEMVKAQRDSAAKTATSAGGGFGMGMLLGMLLGK